MLDVAPARERGLKLTRVDVLLRLSYGRSREGAWIEMLHFFTVKFSPVVAPARERGLKWSSIQGLTN